MSTLRITNIEAKADPSSPTVDEKIKLTNSNGDILVHIDGKTSGITTIGINTTAGNIKFDQNSNVVVTGIITATSFSGDGSALTGIDATQIQTGNTSVQTVDTGSNGHVKINTEGTERLRIDSTGDVRFAGNNLTNNTNKNVNLTAPSYNTSEEDVNLVQVENESGMNQISFGGGTSGLNAATSLRFLTASAVNTTTGSERLRIDSAGDVILGFGGNSLYFQNGFNNSNSRIQNGGATNNSNLKFYTRSSGTESERLRITSGGQVNIGDSDINNSTYTFQVSKDLGTPSASGTNLVHFKNANGTYSQNLYLGFNNSKDIIWTGGSGNGGMTWKLGTRGYNWEIGGTNKFAVGNANATLNGTTDGVLNINTTDGRGSFIRLQENGASKVWVGSAEGMGVGDQDDACLMSVDNIYFRNSTDSRTTLTVSKEGRLTGEKVYPDASGTYRSNPYYPPTNQYHVYSAPSGGNKWMRFGYFASRGRYRITFNSTGGYYSPGSVTFDFNLYWASPHVYVGNISKLSSQYVTKFRVTSNSSGGGYYGEVYVSVNGNQTGSHIHCTAQVLGTGDREFNLYNYGYDLSNLSYTSSDFNL